MCVCSPFRPLSAGNTGQDTMWSEARRQLLEWDASVADGYKVSFPKSHPYPNTTAFPPIVIVHRSESESEKVSDTSRQNEKKIKIKIRVKPTTKNATCTIVKINTNTHPAAQRVNAIPFQG